jgi:DNA polymerase-1
MENSTKQKPNFVIVDANAFVHSSFHGYPPKPDSKGECQRVLHGILNTLVDLTYQLPTIDFLYVVFDPSDGSLYRKSMFPPYKANRPPTDPDLSRQRDVAKKVLEDHLGIPCVSYPGYEADDIIGSISELARHDYRVIIISPDKDLAQLVKDDVILLRKIRTKTEKGYRTVNSENIYQQFGVHAHQIPDWLALMGDTADNLPGLEKVGEKGACNILTKYPTLEHLLAIAHEIEDEKLKHKVLNNKEQLILVKKLATIVCDLPIETHVHKALEKADLIRSNEQYRKRLVTMRKHFSWPDHFLELFLN